jgi:hypothetical protein
MLRCGFIRLCAQQQGKRPVKKTATAVPSIGVNTVRFAHAARRNEGGSSRGRSLTLISVGQLFA